MLAHVDGAVGWLVYNNPERLNAVTYDMQRAVPTVLDAFAVDDDVRVVVVRGAGDRAFVSGADISEFAEQRTAVDARARYDVALNGAWGAWRAFEKPVVAMIRGYCIGGGLLTAMKADIRIAAVGSEFAVPAAGLGLGLTYEHVAELVSLVGPAWAAEMALTAGRIGAEEAAQIGLVNRVVAADELEVEVGEIAARIGGNAPLTLRALKAAIREARRDPAQRDVERVAALVEACYQSQDYLEGQAAFAEKRAPQFRGV
jgi:enoyl-CoA hydratase/carnithine racemase